MPNGIKVTVTYDQFEAEKDVNKKLNMMFQVMSSHQEHCVNTVEDINNRLNVPKRNRKIDLGVGAGGGTIGYVLIDKVVNAIKSYISGG